MGCEDGLMIYEGFKHFEESEGEWMVERTDWWSRRCLQEFRIQRICKQFPCKWSTESLSNWLNIIYRTLPLSLPFPMCQINLPSSLRKDQWLTSAGKEFLFYFYYLRIVRSLSFVFSDFRTTRVFGCSSFLTVRSLPFSLPTSLLD